MCTKKCINISLIENNLVNLISYIVNYISYSYFNYNFNKISIRFINIVIGLTGLFPRLNLTVNIHHFFPCICKVINENKGNSLMENLKVFTILFFTIKYVSMQSRIFSHARPDIL